MILITLFLTCIIGYVLVVIKVKVNLMENTIIIDKKSVTQEFIDEAEVKIFMIGKEEIRTGDEVKLITASNNKIEGIVLGAKMTQNEILIVTHKDEVKKLNVQTIRKIKVVSKYGMFCRFF